MEYSGYRKLNVYLKSHALVLLVYKVTKTFPKDELFCLTSQMRRCSISVPANIVEGYRRFHYLERIKFYLNARASLAECSDHWIDLMYIRKQVSANEYQKYKAISSRLSMKLANFIAASRKAKMREEKHENN